MNSLLFEGTKIFKFSNSFIIEEDKFGLMDDMNNKYRESKQIFNEDEELKGIDFNNLSRKTTSGFSISKIKTFTSLYLIQY